MPLEVPDRDEWFLPSGELPKPDWLAINEWLQNVAGVNDRSEAAWQITRYWAARLAAALGSRHSIEESEHFLLLSTQDKKDRLRMLEFLDSARDHVLNTLGKAAVIRDLRKLVIVRTNSEDNAWAIYASLDPDSTAARQFLANSWPVIYCEPRSFAAERRRLADGAINHLLGHLPLPSWLHRGLSAALEVELNGGRFAVLNEELLTLHHRSWNPDTIQYFWSGKSFWDVEWDQLSLSLADVLFDIIRRELKPDFPKLQRFIQTATQKDAGEAAAQRFFGVGLVEIAAVFLGDRNWTPRPVTWETCEEKE